MCRGLHSCLRAACTGGVSVDAADDAPGGWPVEADAVDDAPGDALCDVRWAPGEFQLNP